MKNTIRIEKSDLKKPRRRWLRKPQTQVVPRKRTLSRKREKQAVQKEWLSSETE